MPEDAKAAGAISGLRIRMSLWEPHRDQVQPISALREIIGIDEAANFLGCSRMHVSNLLRGKVRGLPRIPHVRAGRRRLIRREALIEWFREQERNER
jgi:excisionase family DNA binding protein